MSTWSGVLEFFGGFLVETRILGSLRVDFLSSKEAYLL